MYRGFPVRGLAASSSETPKRLARFANTRCQTASIFAFIRHRRTKRNGPCGFWSRDGDIPPCNGDNANEEVSRSTGNSSCVRKENRSPMEPIQTFSYPAENPPLPGLGRIGDTLFIGADAA